MRKPYPQVDDLLRPGHQGPDAPAAPRGSMSPGGTVHVVARCNNREFYFTAPEDFQVVVAHLRELVRTYEVTLYAYTLMANHIHLLMLPR